MRRSLLFLLVCVACTQTSTPPLADSVAADSADQVMHGVRFYITQDGLRRAEVVSDSAYMYEDNTRTELHGVNATFYKAGGEKDGVLTSREGTYNTRLGAMEAREDVLVVATDGRRLTTPHLKYDPSRNEISSDSTFLVTEKSGRTISGIGFISDPDLNAVRVLRGAKSSNNSVPLPRR